MPKVTLTARVAHQEDGYLATMDSLDLTGRGATAKAAQDDLVETFMSWVQTYDGQGALAQVLLEAGFEQVDENTELELQFAE